MSESDRHAELVYCAIRDLLDMVITDGSCVLDLGAATGLVYSIIGDRCSVVQVESDTDLCSQNKYPVINENLNRYISTIYNIQYQYDFVVSICTIYHLSIRSLVRAVRCAKRQTVLLLYKSRYAPGLRAGSHPISYRKCPIKRAAIIVFLWLNRKRVSMRYYPLPEEYCEAVVIE